MPEPLLPLRFRRPPARLPGRDDVPALLLVGRDCEPAVLPRLAGRDARLAGLEALLLVRLTGRDNDCWAVLVLLTVDSPSGYNVGGSSH